MLNLTSLEFVPTWAIHIVAGKFRKPHKKGNSRVDFIPVHVKETQNCINVIL